MKKTHWLYIIIVLSALMMIFSFLIVPDDSPWYYDVLAFNIGLWPWIFAKRELKKSIHKWR